MLAVSWREGRMHKMDSHEIKKYDPLKLEPEIMEFWKANDIYQKAKSKNSGKKKFYFLDGPPYTSGKIHLGTAWNKPMKDMVLRYRRMKGLDVWDRAGYDMHGLPVELKVEKKLGIKFKDEIPKFGVAKFIEECKKFALDNLQIMNKDFLRLGVWMDFENPYMSITSEFIEGEWWLIKKAHENGRLYEGGKSMQWCSHCATSLAKHELEYENVEDDSIFVKFPVEGKENEFLVIWTTTPWTIPFNLGVMAHPEFDYVKVKIKGADEKWIVAKGLANVFISGVAEKEYEIVEEFKGEKLEGLSYVHPFADIIDYSELKKESPKVHTVVMSDEFVDLSSGSGLVHMAPGCGPEDYEVGKKNDIPPFNTIDEYAKFPDDMGELSGLYAKKDDKKFIEALEKRGALIASTKVQHDYAHCWRCKKPIVFRTTTQWFFKVEDLKEKMKEENKKIKWVPEWAGSKQFDSWLDNLRDNGITRQRYWGTPIPIWRCSKCGEYDVIGSAKELKEKVEKAGSELKELKDLHKPYIDEVKYKCKCSGMKGRIPDIADVWVDAGTVSWNCINYPSDDKLFKEMYPADFILEGKDQIRGWFNLLLVASMVSMNRPSFKAVYMHGFVNDALGRKMSKSLGNIISPYEVIDKYGSDTFRYYAIGGANPGYDLNYNFDDVKVKRRNIEVLWNVHNFLLDYSRQVKLPSKMPKLSSEEKYIISKLNSAVKKVTMLYEEYKLNEIPTEIENLFLELSRTYMQLVREKSSTGEDSEKEAVMWAIYHVLLDSLKMFATIAPFVSEAIYQNLKKGFDLKEESIHLLDWPSCSEKDIDEKLENRMENCQLIIQAVLAGREKAKLGVRWPLSEAVVVTKDDDVKESVKELKGIIMQQCNIRDIKVADEFEHVKKQVKLDHGKIGSAFASMTPKIIAKLASESSESITTHLDKHGKFTVKIEGEAIEIQPEVFIITRETEKPYVEGEFKQGFVYLNTTQNEELENEGFARELMRRVQQMRKNAGLVKTQMVEMFIVTENVEILKEWQEAIKEKVGAEKFDFSADKPAKEYFNKDTAKIKDKEFEIMFDVI